MSVDQKAVRAEQATIDEHRRVKDVPAKAVVPYAWDTATSSLTPFSAGLVTYAYDYVTYTNTSSTTDTYQFYSGGAGGVLVATITINYTDTTKSQISNVART